MYWLTLIYGMLSENNFQSSMLYKTFHVTPKKKKKLLKPCVACGIVKYGEKLTCLNICFRVLCDADSLFLYIYYVHQKLFNSSILR